MGVGNCEDRRAASLPFGAKLGAPLREDIVHLATIFARADGPRWEVEGVFKIQDVGLGPEPLRKEGKEEE